MIHHLDDNGTMAVVLPHGVLFRGAAEGVIRQYLIERITWMRSLVCRLMSSTEPASQPVF